MTVTNDGLHHGGMKRPSRFPQRRVARILIGLFVLVAAAAALSACSPPFAAACSAKGAATATAANTVKVADSQKQGAYQPDPVTVQAGQSVTWTWEDQANQHSVSADDSSFESCLQGAGSTFTTTFVKAGTYAYHCAIHPQMKGTVTVT